MVAVYCDVYINGGCPIMPVSYVRMSERGVSGRGGVYGDCRMIERD